MRKSRDLPERTKLAAALQEQLAQQGGTQATKAKTLGISQPRLSDLLRNRIEKFSLDALVELAKKSGLRLDLNTQSVLLGPKDGLRIRNSGDSPFPVVPSDLGRLDSTEGAKLLLRILRCEVFAVGLSPKDVVLSLRTNVPDGGIDAKVEGSPQGTGFLRPGNTHFQIKSGTSFRPWQPSSLRQELFGQSSASPSRDRLGSEVRDCMEANGTYSLVVFGHDLTPRNHSLSVKHLRELFMACGYDDPEVVVYGQGQIAGEIERYPSIYFDLFGLSGDSLQSIRMWQEQSLMQPTLQLGDEQRACVERLQRLCIDNSAAHIRFVGEPGIGKTRLALEALLHESIAPTVLYVPTGEDFQKSQLFKELLRSEHTYPLTLVVDDCGDHDRASIWSSLKGKTAIKLITIDHGQERVSDSSMQTLECPRLAVENVEEILQGYVGKRIDLRNWAEICDGSPRVAHAVGQNLKENPEDVLRPPATVPIWERFIVGYEKIDSSTADDYRTVLRHVALFSKFGFESPVSAEGEAIARLVQKANPNITYQRFQSVVQHFRERRILQGRHTLFLVPRALHLHFWLEYWKQYGRGFDFQAFLSELPQSMWDWFLRLFTIAHEPPAAREVVKQILAIDGPFSQDSFLASDTAPRLIRYLAEADRHSTMACIARTYGNWDHSKLLAWTDGRQDIVWALEIIAVWDDCFEEAVKVLTKMALAENAQNSNNSKGTLANLFSIGTGWAATKASPEQRFPILKRMIQSRDVAEQELGLELATQWLSTRGGSRIIGPENQGLRPTIDFWRPKLWGEVFDAWREVWRLLAKEIGGLTGHSKNKFARVLVQAADGLVRHEALSTEVLDTLFDLAGRNDLVKKELIAFSISNTKGRGDSLPDVTQERIRELDRYLTGTSLWERLTRYVLHSNWDEDYVVDGESFIESEAPGSRVEELADELMCDFDCFKSHLPRLLIVSGHRLPQLGVECGRLAEEENWDELIVNTVESVEDANAAFLGGFLAGLREISTQRWEAMLLRLIENPMSLELALGCTRSSGVSNEILAKITANLADGSIEPRDLDRFVIRSGKGGVEEELFLSLVQTLLDTNQPEASTVAVELLFEYYVSGEGSSSALPPKLTLESLCAAAYAKNNRNSMRGFYWGRVAAAFLKANPSDQFALLETILASGLLSGHRGSDAQKIAEEVLKASPSEAWKVITGRLASGDPTRYDLLGWLSGELFGQKSNEWPPASLLPVEEVIGWAREDPERRAWKVMQILPKTVIPAKGGELTARFIEEFGNLDQMAGTLCAHFWAGSWSGPESLYLEKKREAARRWLSESVSTEVQDWLSKFISQLTADIERAKIREEREF